MQKTRENQETNTAREFAEGASANCSFIKANPGFNWSAGEQSKKLFYAGMDALYGDQPLMVVGPTGTGKTLFAKQIAYDLGVGHVEIEGEGEVSLSKLLPEGYSTPVPLVISQGTADTTYYSLCGHDTIVPGDGVKFVEGDLPRAIRLANERGVAVLLIDEMNAIRPEYQKAFNSLLTDKNGDRKVVFEDKVWSLNPGAKLLIIATMNDEAAMGYGGINTVNADLLRRFSLKLIVDYPSEEEERKILAAYTNDEVLIEKLVRLAKHTRGSKAAPGVDAVQSFNKPISTADLTNFMREYKVSLDLYMTVRDTQVRFDESRPFRRAMELTILNRLYSEADKEERDALSKKIMDIFGTKAEEPEANQG